MNVSEIKQLLETEVPAILQESPGFREWLQEFIRRQTVPKESFDERFDRLLNEFAADRESQRHHWDEQDLRWKEQERRWEENTKRWAESSRRWDENDKRWKQALEEIRSIKTKQEQSIGAIGARWGVASEASFRAALKGMLEDSFGVEVLNVNEFDHEGIVFGRPDQVELDIIIKNGTLILCELKSSMSKSDMYTFGRKVEYYEKQHQRTANRRIVVSPMVDAKARKVAEDLQIEVFSYSDDITGLA